MSQVSQEALNVTQKTAHSIGEDNPKALEEPKKDEPDCLTTLRTSNRNLSENPSKRPSMNLTSSVRTLTRSLSMNMNMAKNFDEKKVGMGEVARKGINESEQIGIEEHESEVRKTTRSSWIIKFLTTFFSSILVFVVYLISIETMISCALCVGMTLYWYNKRDDNNAWEGSGMDWIVLGFAVITPLTVTITLAFQRRERALYEISRVRSFCFQLYVAHGVWEWNGKDDQVSKDELLKHTDEVLEQLVGIGDELSRFLTLPTSSRSYHKMMKSGRVKAATIVEVAYRLMDSLYTQRIVKISKLSEKIKSQGLSATETSRLRQYERFIGEAIENLRMFKMYRTPQALRSFGRIFTLVLPPCYAPAFAQLAVDLHSLPNGIFFAILTPLLLTALFQTIQAMEDPFVGWVSLDGIDVPEELEILHFQQLISARKALFPDAPSYGEDKKAAIVSSAQLDLGGSRRKSHFMTNSLNGTERDFSSLNHSYRRSHFHLVAVAPDNIQDQSATFGNSRRRRARSNHASWH